MATAPVNQQRVGNYQQFQTQQQLQGQIGISQPPMAAQNKEIADKQGQLLQMQRQQAEKAQAEQEKQLNAQ